MSYWYRYAHGDEVIFVHEGTGMLESQFGTLTYGPGDYLVDADRRDLADRCRTPASISGCSSSRARAATSSRPSATSTTTVSFSRARPTRNATSVRPTRSCTHDETGEFEVRVKARGQISRYIYAHHPLDVVGWDGHLWPFAFNIRDFEPITGRVHQPPPVHQTFEGPGFVRVLVRAATVRLPSAVDPRAVQPFERRFRRSDLLRGRRFHVAPRRRARPRLPCIPTAFRTVRIPARTRDRSARPAPKSSPSWSIRSVR